ncbi:MAG TPA: branched-chain amino acid ABC transporter substrate-binding protein [Candidatus Binatia bacterium]|nr:branched-chain amino acid ABC transporter substrate-binding protein [Candidatus Binatia bacterium]
MNLAVQPVARLCVLLFALLVAACAGTKPDPNAIVIGVAGPMTGDLSAFGQQIRKGAQAAVDDLNAKGGVNGKHLRLVVGDDQCDPKQAVEVANDLVGQHAVFVVGHFCSGSSIPASPVYAAAKVLQMTPSSTNPMLTDSAAAKGIKTVFRVCNRDDWQGKFAGAWLAKAYAGKNLAVLDDLTPYGHGVAEQVAQSAKAAGLEPALRRSFEQAEIDFSSLVAALKEQKIDAVYVGGYHNTIAPLVRQARDQDFEGDFFSDDALNTNEFSRIAGPAADGVRFSDSMTTAAGGGFADNAYAAVEAFAAAATGAGSTDAAKMADWLRANHVASKIGDLMWDAKGDMTRMTYTWFVWHDGSFAPAPGS